MNEFINQNISLWITVAFSVLARVLEQTQANFATIQVDFQFFCDTRDYYANLPDKTYKQ